MNKRTNKKSTLLLGTLIVIVLAIAGYFIATSMNNSMNDEKQQEISLTDKYGNIVNISKAPEKVICYSPELAEILYAIGAGDTLIGRSDYCDYPEEITKVKAVGDILNINLESVLEMKPDLVLLSSMASKELVASLNSKGITALQLDADTSVEGVYSYIEAMGKIFDKNDEAGKLIKKMKKDIEEVKNKTKDLDKPLVYFVVAVGEYDSGATGDTFIGELLELAGAENAAKDGTNWMYSVERLVEKNPEIIICSKLYDTKNQIIQAEGYKDLEAVKNGKIIEIDENIFYRQGPRMTEAILELAKQFHPEVFK